jgi:hypothetical protein
LQLSALVGSEALSHQPGTTCQRQLTGRHDDLGLAAQVGQHTYTIIAVRGTYLTGCRCCDAGEIGKLGLINARLP